MHQEHTAKRALPKNGKNREIDKPQRVRTDFNGKRFPDMVHQDLLEVHAFLGGIRRGRHILLFFAHFAIGDFIANRNDPILFDLHRHGEHRLLFEQLCIRLFLLLLRYLLLTHETPHLLIDVIRVANRVVQFQNPVLRCIFRAKPKHRAALVDNPHIDQFALHRPMPRQNIHVKNVNQIDHFPNRQHTAISIRSFILPRIHLHPHINNNLILSSLLWLMWHIVFIIIEHEQTSIAIDFHKSVLQQARKQEVLSLNHTSNDRRLLWHVIVKALFHNNHSSKTSQPIVKFMD